MCVWRGFGAFFYLFSLCFDMVEDDVNGGRMKAVVLVCGSVKAVMVVVGL